MEPIKAWAKNELNRVKEAAFKELDPKNPVKQRFISAWGLLIAGGLLILVLMFLALQLVSRSSE
jgi:hypothetical protein